MEIIEHDLDCNCHRRREWIEIDGEFFPIVFSVDDPNTPPMSEEEKHKLSVFLTNFKREREGLKQ